ncbi:MAG: LPS export ABC transporter periplasmic protein LptC [Bdellovibrionales bacterium]
MCDEKDVHTQNPADRLAYIGTAVQNTYTYNPFYSKLIRSLKIILPIFAGALIILIFNWEQFNRDTIEPVKNEMEIKAEAEDAKNELLNPRFESLDDKGRPYVLTARRAVQGEDQNDWVQLEQPAGQTDFDGGVRASITADQGAYSQQDEYLKLNENVTLTYDQSYVMTMETLDIDLNRQTAQSDSPIDAKGPEGTLKATGVRADQHTQKVVFPGPATLILYTDDKGLSIKDLTP